MLTPDKLHERIQEIIDELFPDLKYNPELRKKIAKDMAEEFNALCEKSPELRNQSLKDLDPLLKFLAFKDMALEANPNVLNRPAPEHMQQVIEKLINNICKDDPQLKHELKKIAADCFAKLAKSDPSAGNDLRELCELLKQTKESKTNNLSPLRSFKERYLTDAQKANIAVQGQDPETGTDKTIITETKPTEIVLNAITDAVRLTVGAKLQAPGQPIDEADEIARQNKERTSNWPPTPMPPGTIKGG